MALTLPPYAGFSSGSKRLLLPATGLSSLSEMLGSQYLFPTRCCALNRETLIDLTSLEMPFLLLAVGQVPSY